MLAFIVTFTIAAVFGLVYLTTQMPLLDLPVSNSWADMAGPFTGAAALFNGLALIGIVYTLRQ